ncbi:MAG: hypothetical protein QOK10_1484 [Pseudonocardiales bacterium]|jgi:anti-sigma factor RsiW|nr:hypothetical protein [Pseudonocardiales bacterium]
MTERFDAERHVAEHEQFCYDDAAYVLDALDPEDRAAFEGHLRGCPLCQAQVAELRGIPPLLAKADPETWAPGPPPESLLPRLLWQVRIQQRRRRLRIAITAGLAACILTLLSVSGFQYLHHAQQPKAQAFTPVSSFAGSVHASLTLTSTEDGTNLWVECGHYSSHPYSPGGATSIPTSQWYRLVVINRAGARQVANSWPPDRDIGIAANTSWPEKAIRAVEIQDGTGKPIMQVVL